MPHHPVMTSATAVCEDTSTDMYAEARQRRGQHRDRALASWRRSEAIRLKTAGCTYEQIARELGYANRGTVHRIVQQALDVREVESVDELRQLELDRLDALHASLWPQAMDGHVPSVLALLRVLDLRTRLLGLQTPSARKRTPEDSWPSCQGPATVVVHPDDCRHAGCDRHGSFREPTLG